MQKTDTVARAQRLAGRGKYFGGLGSVSEAESQACGFRGTDQPAPERSRFERLAIPHMSAAFNRAYWILRNREEAEDVVQDAYLRAFRAFSGFKGESIEPWLLMIVRNTAFTALRARKRTGSVVLQFGDLQTRNEGEVREAPCTTPSPEALAIEASDRQQLLAALAQLPPVYRSVVILREMKGLSYTRIAEVTDLPIGTVMSRLSRGRAELRKALASAGSGVGMQAD